MKEPGYWLAALGLAAALCAAVLGSGPAAADKAAAPALRAGAASVKITPSLATPVYIAGYAINRVADSVHDDLWARAVVLDDGKTRMAVVVCDLIGLSNYRVRLLRGRVHGVPPENVLIVSTHVHSGPDSLGLWGKGFGVSGLDPVYMDRLGDRISAVVDTAVKDLRPVTLSAGSVTVPDGLVYNSREAIQDKTLTALRLSDANGGTVASIINYGGHPEINKGKAITSDYVGYVREAAEKRFGGVALFLNGALGGMVTPKVTGHTWEEMERVGTGVGRSAVEALEAAKPLPVSAISLMRRDVTIPLENDKFKLMLGLRVLDADPAMLRAGAQFATEVWRVDLGPVTWITIPGEILPRPALELKAKMPGAYPMIVALGNDELGYILEPDDYEKQLYNYERSMSVGSQTWPKLFEAAKELLK